MKFELKYVLIGITTIVLSVVLTNIQCAEEDNWVGKLKKKVKKPFGNAGVPVQKTNTGVRTNGLSTNVYKVVGFTPELKEDNIDELLNISMHEADLLKMAAYKKLKKKYKEATSFEEKKKLLDAIMKSAAELIKYYGVVYNCPKKKVTLFEGLDYVKKCRELKDNKDKTKGNDDIDNCYKRKALLLSAFFLSNKLHVNHIMRHWLRTSMDEAQKRLPKDKELALMRLRIACEVKLMVQNKNDYVRIIMVIFTGSTEAHMNVQCVNELLKFKDDYVQAGSNILEYYYLLARAYAKDREFRTAIKYLDKIRQVSVINQVDRYINKQVQELYEKLYFKLYL